MAINTLIWQLFWPVVCIPHSTCSSKRDLLHIYHTELTWLGPIYGCSDSFTNWADFSRLNVAGFRLACYFAATPRWLFHRAASLSGWIEFNFLRSAQDAACRLFFPLHCGKWRLRMLYKCHHQSGCSDRQASLKAAYELAQLIMWFNPRPTKGGHCDPSDFSR